MFTLLFNMVIKEGREEEFAALARELARSTNELDAGCLAYTFHRVRGKPREFVLYERWRGSDDVQAHLRRFFEVLGPAPEGGGPLPAKLADFFESTSAIPLEVVD